MVPRYWLLVVGLVGCGNINVPGPRNVPPELDMRPNALTTNAESSPSLANNTPANDPLPASKSIETTPNAETHVWIKPYTRTDGIFVEGHWRAKTDLELRAQQRKEAQSLKAERDRREAVAKSNPPETAEEKTVQVKGYTRKDGTYVAPYTRKAPRKK